MKDSSANPPPAGRVAAHHEAGHVVAAYVLDLTFVTSSIVPDKLFGYSGFTGFHRLMTDAPAYKAERDDLLWRRRLPSDKADELMRRKVTDEAAMRMAGPVAQSMLTGERLQDIWSGDADKTLIRLLARTQTEQQQLRVEAANAAAEILREKWHLVEAVASGLLRHEELDAERLKEILKGAEKEV